VGVLYYGFWAWRTSRRQQEVPLVSRAVVRGLLISLVVLGVFSSADKYAAVNGVQDAEYVASTLVDRRGVVVYSKADLSLPAAVRRTTLRGSNLQYRYRYDDLRLFLRHGGSYLLVPATWSRADSDPTADVLIILPESGDLRFEFTPGIG
jgi:hypothetical protein